MLACHSLADHISSQSYILPHRLQHARPDWCSQAKTEVTGNIPRNF